MCRVRELTTAKVSTLLYMCISGQVVYTHPVHSELVSGAFLECQTAVPDVEQQFKFTQVCVTPPQVFHHPPTWCFLSLLPFIFPRFPHLFLLSFSPSPSYPTFHSPSMPSPSPLPPHHPYWSYITLTHSTPPSTFHPSLLVFHFTPLISSSTPLPLLPFSLPL